ncbi:MAG: DNA mismatch endonuclease Vsr [Acidobacteria bacterium]|nr:DNA mismatch endonuclease Vsr [Acidobacteriota bacterium]
MSHSPDPIKRGRAGAQRPSASVSARMSAVKQSHTVPELAVRRILHSLGARYRVCSRAITGRPDISNRAHAWCIFVHGCFWHGHDCARGRLPKVNVDFWKPKISRNQERDEDVRQQLSEQGFSVLTVWQCELDNMARLRNRLARFLRLRVNRTT